MGDPRGFLNVKRKSCDYRMPEERKKDFKEVFEIRAESCSKEQTSRCMDCGTPFCHWACPVGNVIPEWNDLVYRGKWEEAYKILDSTNILPEVTGRVCPALCEYACVLGINDDPVTVKDNELGIIEYAFEHGIIRPRPPLKRSGKKVAIIGSGPSGISAAAFLNRAGHEVTVFEKDDKIGGVMRYGIPDFKLDKSILERRIGLLSKEGILFKTNSAVGSDISMGELRKIFDAVCLTTGSRVPRDLRIEGRELKGIYFAMDFLVQANRAVAIEKAGDRGVSQYARTMIDVKGKNVVVIGGGDTGADCVGVANRQGARHIVQIELLSKPTACRLPEQPWPKYPNILRTSSSHEEGCERCWAIMTKKFIGETGQVKKLLCSRVDFSEKDEKGCAVMKEIPGSEFEIKVDVVLLALGFLHPEHSGIINELGLELDNRGNVKTDEKFMTSQKGVFAAGDARRGQSLIVWAVDEGIKAAESIGSFLKAK